MFARPFIMLCHVAPFCPQFETSVRNTHKLTHAQNTIWFLQLIITLKPQWTRWTWFLGFLRFFLAITTSIMNEDV